MGCLESARGSRDITICRADIDPKNTNYGGQTPLTRAIRNGYSEVVKILPLRTGLRRPQQPRGRRQNTAGPLPEGVS